MRILLKKYILTIISLTFLIGSLFFNHYINSDKVVKFIEKQEDRFTKAKDLGTTNKIVVITIDTIKPKEVKIVKEYKSKRLLSGFTKNNNSFKSKDSFEITDKQTTNIIDSITIKPKISIKKHKDTIK